MKPYISNIQRFSVDDGPGIRTTVFLKGCNLRCLWCHNPECIDPGITLQLIRQSCTLCGKCASKCQHGVHSFKMETGTHRMDRASCVACGECVYYCPASALSLIGKKWEPADLVAVLLKDWRYFGEDGGVTISGGEPMLYPDYVAAVASLLKEDIDVCIDTAGCVPFESFEKVMPYVDHFLYDIKMWTESKHIEATGVSNKLILENLRKLCEAGASVIIRTPVIMEWNGDLAEFDEISRFLSNLHDSGHGVDLIQLLPYHAYGVGKYDNIGKVNQIKDHTPPTDELMEQALQKYLEKGLPARIK